VSIDAAIREQITETRRRSAARRRMSKALNEHRLVRARGLTLYEANVGFMRVLREYADDNEAKVVSNAFIDSMIKKALRSALDELLEELGLEEFPIMKDAVSRVLMNAFIEIVTKRGFNFLSMTCREVGDVLARSAIKTLPEAIFDSLVSGVNVPRQVDGVMLTVREAISNFVRDTEVSQKIADKFSEFVCNIDLSDLVMRGGEEIEQALNKTVGRRSGPGVTA
jgi:hypothetical protein